MSKCVQTVFYTEIKINDCKFTFNKTKKITPHTSDNTPNFVSNLKSVTVQTGLPKSADESTPI